MSVQEATLWPLLTWMINVAWACDICEYAPIEELFARYISPGAASSLKAPALQKVCLPLKEAECTHSVKSQ